MAAAAKIIFFGNERLATGVTTQAPTLQALLKAGYDVRAVVVNHEQSKSRNARELEIAAVAKQHSIPLLMPDKPADILDELADLGADIGVLVAYGRIVPQAVIDLFPRGIVNIHPSLLPHHRGPTPLESVILHNEPATGVSIMQLVRDMDAGPVFGQVELPLAGTETKQDLANTLLQKGAELLIELLPAICAEELLPLPQDELKATYDQLINKEDGQLDFTKPAEQLEREVRAYAEWPKSRTQLAGRDVTIEQAHVEIGVGKPGSVWRDSANQFGVYCGQDILVIDQLRPAGKGSMTAAAFLAGYNPL